MTCSLDQLSSLPCSVAIEAMQSFLKNVDSPEMLQTLEDQNVWSLFEKEDTYPHGVLHIARALSAGHNDLVQSCVDEISSSLTSIYDANRITVVSFYSEVVICEERALEGQNLIIIIVVALTSWYVHLVGRTRHPWPNRS